MLKPMRFGIIGAGIAGLACADALKASGHCVSLFDKGRGPGGRMSTRRLETPAGPVALDHGAQYFTARDPDFLRLVRGWNDQGIASPWPLAGADAWVGMPGMNAVVRCMAAAHDVSWSHLVTSLSRQNGAWWLHSKDSETGPFDAVMLAIPAEQAAAMLSLHDFAMGRTALFARSQPCWTGMFVFGQPLDALPPLVRNTGNIAWAARNCAKPGRAGPEAWVVQANAAWSSEWLETPPEQVAVMLLGELVGATGCAIAEPVSATVHRWRFALSAGTGDGALWNADISLGVCGDWLLGPRVECAWLSGRMLAERCGGTGQVAKTAQATSLSVRPSP